MKLQFSLRTALIGFVVLSAIVAWSRWQLSIVAERKAVLALTERAGAIAFPPILEGEAHYVSWPRRQLGDEAVPLFLFETDLPRELLTRTAIAFPEADIWISTNETKFGWRVFDASQQ